MKPWVLFAIISMFFAGLTSVIAKVGLTGITGELGLAIRTVFVFVYVLIFASVTVPISALSGVGKANVIWLGISGLTTALSWIFYYKALKDGQVSTIALIDKGSIVVAMALAVFVLKERLTIHTVVGGLLMISGIIVIAKR